MKKILSLLACVSIFICVTSCSTEKNPNTDTSTTTETTSSKDDVIEGGFTVEGTKLIDAKGNEFIIRGINQSHAWFTDYDETALDAIEETGANCVRIVCSNGMKYTKDTEESLNKVVDMCKERNMIAVLEVHDGTGDDNTQTLDEIADYWVEMKDVFIGNEAYVILNIANEWVGKWDGETWRDGYINAIPKIREAGIKNTIMVDAAGWGQYGQSVSDYGKDVFASDPDKNTMFSIHMYGTAGKDEKTIKSNIDGVISKDLCLIIGEFGYNHSDGDVDEEFIMKYCTENNIGYMGWSWKGNSGGVEYLDIAKEWDGSVLSEDWGENLINGTNGIKETSVQCTVFDK